MRGMRIDGSGGGAWHRDRETQAFGAKAWREYHGMTAGAQRARHDAAGRDRARHELAEQEARRAEADDQAVERLALEHAEEMAQLEAARSNVGTDHALTVRIKAPQGLPESSVASLLSHGFRWSPRRGGIWWAPWSPLACRVAELAILAGSCPE